MIYGKSGFIFAKLNYYGIHTMTKGTRPIFIDFLVQHFLNTQHFNIVFGYH